MTDPIDRLTTARNDDPQALTEWLSEDEDNGELLIDSLDAKATETLRAILAADEASK